MRFIRIDNIAKKFRYPIITKTMCKTHAMYAAPTVLTALTVAVKDNDVVGDCSETLLYIEDYDNKESAVHV